MTRMAFFADGPIGSQSSALASTITGKGESRQSRRVVSDMASVRPGAASPGPTRTALTVSGSLKSGVHNYHHRLQLRRHRMINGFLGLKRDQAGLRALRAARGQNRRAVKSQTARDNSPDGQTSPCDRPTVRRGGKFLKSSGNVQFNSLLCGHGSQAHVFRDFEPSDKRPRVLREQTDFRRADGHCDRRFNRRPRCGSPVSAFKPDGTSTAKMGIPDRLTVSMNFFHPPASGRLSPMPNSPSMINAGF